VGLTLDRAVRLLRSALAERALPLEMAIALVEYHAKRNEIAKASHDKAWYAKHEGVKFLLL
jgi:antitoxin component of RelBE/YafQ-DinJ toxin-antitoxin module